MHSHFVPTGALAEDAFMSEAEASVNEGSLTPHAAIEKTLPNRGGDGPLSIRTAV
jgi:hypothetical protein